MLLKPAVGLLRTAVRLVLLILRLMVAASGDFTAGEGGEVRRQLSSVVHLSIFRLLLYRQVWVWRDSKVMWSPMWVNQSAHATCSPTYPPLKRLHCSVVSLEFSPALRLPMRCL